MIMFDYLFESVALGGVVMIPLFIVSVWGWTLALAKTVQFRRELPSDEKFVERICEFYQQGRWSDFESHCTSRTLRGKILMKILQNRQSSEAQMIHSLNEFFLKHWPSLENGLRTMTLMTTVSPLLGLLGTVSGMIHTFYVITAFGAGNPVLMAGGISEALITTQFGLVVAFPLMVYANYLNNTKNKIRQVLETIINRILNIEYGVHSHV